MGEKNPEHSSLKPEAQFPHIDSTATLIRVHVLLPEVTRHLLFKISI